MQVSTINLMALFGLVRGWSVIKLCCSDFARSSEH